MIFIRSLFHC